MGHQLEYYEPIHLLHDKKVRAQEIFNLNRFSLKIFYFAHQSLPTSTSIIIHMFNEFNIKPSGPFCF